MLTNQSAVAREAYQLGAFALLVAAAVILTALGFEFIGGLEPCHLCVIERKAYYAGIPVLFLSLIAISAHKARWAALGFALVGLGFLANAGLGTYHSGAEYGLWMGPTTCSGALQPLDSPALLLKGLKTVRVVRCDVAPWWFLGISMAGWNAVVSALLWITLWVGARQAWQAGDTSGRGILL